MPRKVLVVDDEEILTKTFSRLLRTKGFEAQVARRAEEALKLAAETDFDLMLCDVRMPGQDGVSTTRQIRKLRQDQGKPAIPVIFLTGYADKQLEEEALSLDPLAFLFKPFDAFKLLELIEEKIGSSV